MFWKAFFRGGCLKNFCEDLFFFFFFFGEHLRFVSLALASSIPILGLESVCPRKGCPWPWPRIFFVSLALALASSLVSSTPPLLMLIISSLHWYNLPYWQRRKTFAQPCQNSKVKCHKQNTASLSCIR